jgi:CRISPR-associated endonuclease Csn1
MEYDYWKNKVDRFTRDEIPQGFVNSQLRDTQIITKYAFHYLKTVFNKVEVQKGEVTAQFRKIFQIQEKDEKKNRAKHHHHAIDAAVLTLIPESAKREEILKKAYDYEERNIGKQYHELPFKNFNYNLITEIEKTILINNIPDKDRALSHAKRIIRKRGSIVWLQDNEGKLILDDNGNKIPKIAQGDSIRGGLHAQTFYGKVKVVQRDKEGKPLRDESNNWKFEEKNDGFRFVLRIPIEKLTSIEQIVDPNIAKMIEKQLDGKKLSEAITNGLYMLDKEGNKVNKIRRIRTWARSTNLLTIKEQTYKSATKDYKNFYYADTGDNYAFALYLAEDGKKKIVSRNLFEISQFKDKSIIKTIDDLFEKTINLSKSSTARLHHIFQVGQKVLFFKENNYELKDLENKEISSRLYFVKTLFDAKQGLIQFQHHLEARKDDELLRDFPEKNEMGDKLFGKSGKNGFSSFSTDFIQPRLLISANNLNCIIENKDFKMTIDGKIEFLF